MVNPYRGEIEAQLDGEKYTLCLTLGALAELEMALGEGDMLAVAERLSSGRLRADEALRVLGAGLRGAGYALDDNEVATMQVEGGAAGYVGIVAQLLEATFGASSASPVGGAADGSDRVA